MLTAIGGGAAKTSNTVRGTPRVPADLRLLSACSGAATHRSLPWVRKDPRRPARPRFFGGEAENCNSTRACPGPTKEHGRCRVSGPLPTVIAGLDPAIHEASRQAHQY